MAELQVDTVEFFTYSSVQEATKKIEARAPDEGGPCTSMLFIDSRKQNQTSSLMNQAKAASQSSAFAKNYANRSHALGRTYLQKKWSPGSNAGEDPRDVLDGRRCGL